MEQENRQERKRKKKITWPTRQLLLEVLFTTTKATLTSCSTTTSAFAAAAGFHNANANKLDDGKEPTCFLAATASPAHFKYTAASASLFPFPG